MKVYFLILSLLLVFNVKGQTINHPKNSTAITKVDNGISYHYYDSGGKDRNYLSGTNSLLTIYPSKKDQFVSLNCNSFDIKTDCRMYIFDGNHAGSPILGYFDGGKKTKKMKAGDVFTASAENESGALSIRFINVNKLPANNGWDFTVSSLKEAGAAPKQTTQDCSGAIKVCSDSAITTKSLGKGYQELPGPNFWNRTLNYGKDGENQSNWYKFEVAHSGSIEFIIKPHNQTDFDWALWGPYNANKCPAWTTDRPYRASAGQGSHSKNGVTGLSSRSIDLFEGSAGDGFVAQLNVNKGEHYVLMIDDWSGNNTTFDLTWSFLKGAKLECAQDKSPPSVPTKEEIEAFQLDIEIDTATNDLESPIEIETLDMGPKLEATISTDQSFVTVSYPGAFEFKIENAESRTVITGHAVDSDEVEITRIPPGTYRVSLIYKQIKQYTTFVKN